MQTIVLALISLSLTANKTHQDRPHKASQIRITALLSKTVAPTRQYVCQIHAQRHINVRVLADGFLERGRLHLGQPGTVVSNRVQNDALDRWHVDVVDEEDMARDRHPERIGRLLVIKYGLGVNDEIVLDGIRQVHDGDKRKFEGRQPDQIVASHNDRAE